MWIYILLAYIDFELTAVYVNASEIWVDSVLD